MELNAQLHTQAISPHGNEPEYPPNGKLGQPQNQPECFREVKKKCPCQDSNPGLFSP
jgi:hypothetical protein